MGTLRAMVIVSAACICGALTTHANAQVYLDQDFSLNNGGFSVVNGIGAGVPAGPWTYSAGAGMWSATGGEGVVNSAIVSPAIVVSDAGGVGLAFDHRYFFEDDGTTRWDGGLVQFSVNGGAYQPVAAAMFRSNGYPTDRLITGNCPPVSGQFAFNGKSAGYDGTVHINSVASLGSFAAGDQLRLRFIGAWDEGYTEPGVNWEISTLSVFHDANPIILPDPGLNQLRFETYKNIPGVLVSDLRNSPKFPNNPDTTSIVNVSAIPVNQLDSYGARLSGYFTPDVAGVYDFYMASDDQGELYLSSDADPAHAVLIAREPVWNPSNQFSTLDRRDPAAPENRSTTLFPEGIPLEAGTSYYIEALMKEEGGGDNLAFTAALRTDPGVPAPIPTGPIGALASNAGAVQVGTLSLTPIPEPGSVLVLALGGIAAVRRQRRR